MIDYKLIRSKRKTLAIHITGDATVEVRAPLKLPQEDIEAFLNTKAEWVEKKLIGATERLIKRDEFSIENGSTLLYRGMVYQINTECNNKISFDGETFFIPELLSQDNRRLAAIALYKGLARQILRTRTMHYAALMKLSPTGVGISSAKTRWGSCSGKGRINYSWRLVLASDDVIDYVVVHELAHLLEMNHSSRFWKVVEETLPDYRSRQSQLVELQYKISGLDWD